MNDNDFDDYCDDDLFEGPDFGLISSAPIEHSNKPAGPIDKRIGKDEFLSLPPGSVVRRHYNHLGFHRDYTIICHYPDEGTYLALTDYGNNTTCHLTDGGICPYDGEVWNQYNWTELILRAKEPTL